MDGGGGTREKTLESFRVGQYNILGACLFQNLKAWFWYGYRGIEDGKTYLEDEFESVRGQVSKSLDMYMYNGSKRGESERESLIYIIHRLRQRDSKSWLYMVMSCSY